MSGQGESTEHTTSSHKPSTSEQLAAGGQIIPSSNPLPLPSSSLTGIVGVTVSDVPGDILYQWRLQRRLEQARNEAAVNTRSGSGQTRPRLLVPGLPHEIESRTEVVGNEEVKIVEEERIGTSSRNRDRVGSSGESRSGLVCLGALPDGHGQRCEQGMSHGCCRCARPSQCVPSHTHLSCDVLPCPQHLHCTVPHPLHHPRSRREKCSCHSCSWQEPRDVDSSSSLGAKQRTGHGSTRNSGHSRKRHARPTAVRYPNSVPSVSKEEPPLDLTSTSEWCNSPSPRRESTAHRLDPSLLSQVQHSAPLLLPTLA